MMATVINNPKADLAREMAYLQAMSLLKQGSFTLAQAVRFLRKEYKKAARDELRVG